MNALLIPILIVCAVLVAGGFVVWMVVFSRSGREALNDQHLRERKNSRRPT